MDGTRLFHVRGTNDYNTRAVQVEEKASSLNSNDCFVLETPKCTYIWYGKVSNTQNDVVCVYGKSGYKEIGWWLHG